MWMLDVGHSIQDSAILNSQDVTMANTMADSVWPMVSSEDLRIGNLPGECQDVTMANTMTNSVSDVRMGNLPGE